MTYLGRVEGGVIVVDGDEKPDEGVVVRIEVVGPDRSPETGSPPESTAGHTPLAQRLLTFSGVIKGGFPSDSSLNVDHYLYGHPKR